METLAKTDTEADTLLRVKLTYHEWMFADGMPVRDLLIVGVDLESLLGFLSSPPQHGQELLADDYAWLITRRRSNLIRRIRAKWRSAGADVPIESISYQSPLEIMLYVSAGTLLAQRLIKLASDFSALRLQWASYNAEIERVNRQREAAQLLQPTQYEIFSRQQIADDAEIIERVMEQPELAMHSLETIDVELVPDDDPKRKKRKKRN